MSRSALLLEYIAGASANNELIKITLGGKRDKTSDLKNVYVKPVLLKAAQMLSFVYRYNSKDITKNYSPAEATELIKKLLTSDFFNADVFTASKTFYFSADDSGKEKLVTKNAEKPAPALSHDREKNRVVDQHAFYLKALGVTGCNGAVKKEMQHKFKQINRYIEIIDGIIKNDVPAGDFSVVDMGSGKGYLTFALYDHLQKKNTNTTVTGIELRKELVAKCNEIAAQAGYNQLFFKKGNISDTSIGKTDMLIALHACDTATDDAIAKGINANAACIICAPCCHKQIRKQMAPKNALEYITQHGILLERQAEMVTDTIRALILEAHGYKTKVFEFIDEEHTPKNVLIVGVKNNAANKTRENLEKIEALKEMFGIKQHYLETIL